MIGHELRNPLAALVLSAELISECIDELDRDEIGNLLMSLQSRARGLQVLVDNLMQQSGGGQLKLNVEPLTIQELVADVSLTVEPLLARNRQTLHVRGTALTLVADRARLAQVLVNLVVNASKFSRPDTAIELEFEQDESMLWCEVADRGIGLPPGSTAWLFEPAAQADESSTGLGLGLAIVKSIIEAHGGCVGAMNRADGGARFWFALPRVKEAAPVVGQPIQANSLARCVGS
jgi:signal transduction histidine kinase